jgi:hypothetical protein
MSARRFWRSARLPWDDEGGLVAPDETELSEAIKAVRSGLTAAQQDCPDPEIRFKVKEIVLDLSIEIRKTKSAGGGVKAYVMSGEARGERSNSSTHRMTVTLEVDGPVLIGDRGETAGRPSGPAFR